jgi:hypothetical protein
MILNTLLISVLKKRHELLHWKPQARPQPTTFGSSFGSSFNSSSSSSFLFNNNNSQQQEQQKNQALAQSNEEVEQKKKIGEQLKYLTDVMDVIIHRKLLESYIQLDHLGTESCGVSSQYVYHRLKMLTTRGNSKFQWNGGGTFKNRSWADNRLPTDAEIMMNVFSANMDEHWILEQGFWKSRSDDEKWQFAERFFSWKRRDLFGSLKRPFTDMYVKDEIDSNAHAEREGNDNHSDSNAPHPSSYPIMVLGRRSPPHFEVSVKTEMGKRETLAVAFGKNNYLSCVLIFLQLVVTECDSLLYDEVEKKTRPIGELEKPLRRLHV